jgi:hypothetical protein
LHGVVQFQITVVQLCCVAPGGEIGVFAMGDIAQALRSLHRKIVPGGAGGLRQGALDIILRIIVHPGMIAGRMIGDKIQDEPQARLVQTGAQAE